MDSQDIIHILNITSIVILANGIFQNLVHLIELFISFIALTGRAIFYNEEETWWSLSEVSLPISILMPAYNEEMGIADAVKSMLSLHYPDFEVIVINDGSKDKTLEILIENFDLKETLMPYDKKLDHAKIRGFYKSEVYPKLIVVDKDNGGKADALNAGINTSKNPLFCAIDGDSILEADSLLRVVQPFVERPDKVVAVGGSVRIANGSEINNGRIKKLGMPKNILAIFQIVEYLRAFLIARLALSKIESTVLISGAFGIFKKSVAIKAGGFSKGIVGEDMEIIMKIHKYLRKEKKDYEILFTPEPVCWTEAPSDLKSLSSQRARWQQGALEVFFKHVDMLLNPKYGVTGIIGFLYILSSDIIGPIIELIGFVAIPVLWYYDVLNNEFLLAFFAVTFVFGMFLSVCSLVLCEMELKNYEKPQHLIILFLAAIVENFGYRQINNIWRLNGWYRFLLKKKGWGSMKRMGFKKK
jgi:cellulose synthase/poly-beta-1,6-N-acetylglucosamine synthase-like glycosyltransferase